MNKEETKRIIETFKNSREKIGEQYETLIKEVDDDLKNVLTEEEYNVWNAVNSDEEKEQKIINKIGKERYSQILSKISDKISDKMKKTS